MEVIIRRDVLTNNLQRMQYMLEKTSVLQHSQNILMQVEADQAQITAYDVDCSARATFPVSTGRNGTVCINGKKFFEIVRSLGDEQVTVRQDEERNLVTIRGSKSSFNILCAEPEDFPEVNFTSPEDHFFIQADMLKQLIDRTVFSIAKVPDPRYNLEGVFIEVTPAGTETAAVTASAVAHGAENDGGGVTHLVTFVATDGHRVSIARTDKIGGRINLGERRIFSRKSLMEIKNIFSDSETLKISFSASDVHVRGETFVLLLRMLKGNFPDYRKMIPQHFSHEIVMERESLLQILRRMNVLAYDKYKGITMDFADRRVTVSIDNPEMGSAREDMEVDYTAEPFTVAFNIRYLLDFMQVVGGERIVMKVTGGMQPCMLSEEGSENFINGIMPMKG
ncbi:MAG: DNA polymerase III subunit beta [Deltaproteobacteria bacterium]|nr:DNA polymerase III subunit beta [Candidatus Anaeroferrophillacea bacterium]